MKRYEGMFILDTAGKEEGIKDLIDKISSEIAAAGGKGETLQKMDKLGLAVNRTWKTETGETKEDVLFIDIEAFSRQAETIGQYLKKGSPVLVEGRLRLDTWDDKQTNQKRSKILVTAENVKFLSSGQPREGGAPEET